MYLRTSLRFIACICILHCFTYVNCVSETENANLRHINQIPPSIGAYGKNFAGRIVKVISEIGGSDATLPVLDVTDHIWEGKSIELDCNASYPVHWTYSGPGSPAVHVQTYRQAPDFTNVETYRFSSTVTFTHTDRKQTGNYSCQSIENPNLQTSIYLFVPGKGGLFLDGPTKDSNNITAITWSETIETESKWITFPCAVTIKDTPITFFKKESSGNVKIGISTEETAFLKYSPKIGFRYKWDGQNEGPWGMYSCQGLFKDAPEDMMFNLVKPDPSTDQAPRGALTIKYDKDERRIECCSAGTDRTIRPKMVQSRCESVSDCEIRQEFVQDKPCSKKCLEHLYDSTSDHCSAYQLGNYSDSGLIQCSWPKNESTTQGIIDSVQYYQFSYSNGIFLSEFNTMPALETILEIIREEPMENATASYSCNANHFFFSHGIKWALRSQSGSLSFIPEDQFPAKHQIRVDNDDGESILCFAPIWNSATEWRNVSMKLGS